MDLFLEKIELEGKGIKAYRLVPQGEGKPSTKKGKAQKEEQQKEVPITENALRLVERFRDQLRADRVLE